MPPRKFAVEAARNNEADDGSQIDKLKGTKEFLE
jgi:hypothetical protein